MIITSNWAKNLRTAGLINTTLTNTITPKRKKWIFKCKKCKKVYGEYYSPYPAGEGTAILCEPCHQLEKLKE